MSKETQDPEFTPGPWKYVPAKKIWRPRIQAAKTFVTFTDESIRLSDARLLTMAPELFWALRSLLWATQHNTGYEPSVSCYERALDDAERVLKQAMNGRTEEEYLEALKLLSN